MSDILRPAKRTAATTTTKPATKTKRTAPTTPQPSVLTERARRIIARTRTARAAIDALIADLDLPDDLQEAA